MTDIINQALSLLREAELPAQSAGIERGVMARIDAMDRARETRHSLGLGVGAAAVAMIIGMASVNMVPVSDAMPLEMSAFSANAAFAPATLLATEG
jgi:hypothetical protein